MVAFGASAGGIEAFTSVLKHLDAKLGMAYVLVMHLSPNHNSSLAQIMQSKTQMPVQTVRNGMAVKANNVYVIPPNTFMSLVDGHLKLAPRSLTSNGNYVIDYFLTALAHVYKNNAIGVILSGTASDGTLGLKAVKAEGGITFAQDESAEFSGMPRSAYDSGFVDFRMSTEEIARELARLVKDSYTHSPPDEIEARQVKEVAEHTEELKAILSIVKQKSGVDFFLHYKHASIYRRVVRRMVLNNFDNLKDYHSLLKKNQVEVDSLYNDFLINVTRFFRDHEFYQALVDKVFPALLKKEKPADTFRIWIAGCATGEEAYSVAISLIEFLEKIKLKMHIQIFASDLDGAAIEKARSGIYPLSALQGISSSRLKHYFIKTKNEYQIVKSVRELCVFSQHNLLKDPPFSRMDLISCQNVLIYLEAAPQRRIVQTFHYALKPKGFLFLGKSENISTAADLFDPLDKKIKLFTRKQTHFPQLEFTVQSKPSIPSASITGNELVDGTIDKEINKLLLSRFVYPGVVVNKSFTIVHFFGVTSPYLEPVTGKASFNILKMVREDLVIDLGSLLQQARRTEKVAVKEGIRLVSKKVPHEVTIEVVPKRTHGDLFFLVVFKETPLYHPVKIENGAGSGKNSTHERTIAKLQEELLQSREVIRTTNEEYETTYEELQANNEEILSSNEELQSVNEELESSKEELQSSNEELMTTNEELHKRNIELKESQQQLVKVNEQLEQFAFISSHDLQEPLRKIITFAGFLGEPEANLNKFAQNYSDKISASASRMSALIHDLLLFSSLMNENGDRRELVKVDLNVTLKKVMEDFDLIIAEQKAVVTISSLPSVYAEPVQMQQLFHNLISNALKFSTENPLISILSKPVTSADYIKYPLLAKEKKYISVSVNDNGIGFDQIYAEKIFLLFQRLNDHKEAKGNGLGLALCKKIVEDQGGLIVAQGEPNKGASFIVFLLIN